MPMERSVSASQGIAALRPAAGSDVRAIPDGCRYPKGFAGAAFWRVLQEMKHESCGLTLAVSARFAMNGCMAELGTPPQPGTDGSSAWG